MPNAQRVWPATSIGGVPSYDGRYLRQANSVFLGGATASRPLGARSGVRIGTPTSTVAATATTWTVNPHPGVIDLEATAIEGPYNYAVDAALTGPVTAAGATPRHDIIYAQINDYNAGDGTGSSTPPFVRIDYVAGTTNVSGTLEATVPPRSFVLAYINVPISGGGSPTVSWVAPYSPAAGGIIPVRNQAERDAIAFGTAEYPVCVDRLDKGWIERYTGGTWSIVAFPAYYGEATGPGGGLSVANATLTGMGALTVGTNDGANLTAVSQTVVVTRAGYYSIQQFIQYNIVTSGRSFVNLLVNGAIKARAVMSGEEIGVVSIAAIKLAASDAISAEVFQSSGGSRTMNSQIYVHMVRPA